MPDLAPQVKRSKRKLLEGKTYQLRTLLQRAENPFSGEVASLRLLKRLLQLQNFREKAVENVAISRFRVNCKKWSLLADPTARDEDLGLEVTMKPLSKNESWNPIGRLPAWATGNRRWQMAAGMVLRCAFMGTDDPTQFWRPDLEPATGYRGIRSGWYKRRYGMFNRPDGLGGAFAGCSSWFSELLAKLLAWPGGLIRDDLIAGRDQIATRRQLIAEVEQQLKRLKKQYAVASAMPVYSHRVVKQTEDLSRLRVVMIQTVRPWDKDLRADILLNKPDVSGSRREHLAAMLRLAEAHLLVKKTYENSSDSSGPPRRADLTLLPEMSVHVDDLDLVERYVDRTHSAVFCGLVCYDRRVGGQLQRVNEGRWIVRDESASGRSLRHVAQGKQYPTQAESDTGVVGFRPYQAVLEFYDEVSKVTLFRLTGSICFDATDLALVSDLRSVSDLYAVLANNRDITTFDAMAAAYKFHMHQHVAVVNSGEYGGSLIHAPFKLDRTQVLTHHHGGSHAAISVVDIDLTVYRSDSEDLLKSWPANFGGR